MPKNQKLVELREQLGLKTMAAFARAVGLEYSTYVNLENQAVSPVESDGRVFRRISKKIADFHGVGCNEIWPDRCVDSFEREDAIPEAVQKETQQ